MSGIFYASFIPGLQNIIEDVVRQRLSDVKIHRLLDGAVIFETETTYDKLNFFCFNNIFAVVHVMEHTESSGALEKHLNFIMNLNTQSAAGKKGAPAAGSLRNSAINLDPVINNSKKFRTFRVVVSDENKPASIDEKQRTGAEKFISQISGLKVNRALPDTEFWFLYRSEKFSVFMKRLTLRPSWEKTLQKGELPPPLAWILCRLTCLNHDDTVLDPFCGYGSIPQAAVKHFHIKKFISCDVNIDVIRFASKRFDKNSNNDLVFHNIDFYNLPSLIADKTIDAVITDPPWGIFAKYEKNDFVKKMFSVFERLLKPGGRAVILYADDDCFLNEVPQSFELINSYPVLLSGKKAVLYSFLLKL